MDDVLTCNSIGAPDEEVTLQADGAVRFSLGFLLAVMRIFVHSSNHLFLL